LVSAYAGYKAVQYTIFLAAIYLPVSILLSRRAERMAGTAGASTDGEHGPQLKDLDPQHGWATFKALAAILAPIATGLLGQFLQVATR
jgi:hypothetical protein